jgi:enamine deaminase RidA (YjgF/YER057c/UK114 family)
MAHRPPLSSYTSTNNPFEHAYGYRRAVRRGPFIAVSGCTSIHAADPYISPSDAAALVDAHLRAANETSVWNPADSTSPIRKATPPRSSYAVGDPGNARAQAITALRTGLAAVRELGGLATDVVRVRFFVARAEDCGAVGAAMRCLGMEMGVANEVPGGRLEWAATMIVVGGDSNAFVDAEVLVEVEMDAYVLKE